jgi:hypothetical protein
MYKSTCASDALGGIVLTYWIVLTPIDPEGLTDTSFVIDVISSIF